MVVKDARRRSDGVNGPGTLGRREHILARLRSSGNVLVSDLALGLSTSEITIRRDLKLLEAEGIVRRIHGGAVLVPNRTYEPTFSEKSRQFMDEKRRIGAAAARLVSDGDAIILGPGTTTMEVARQLHGRRNLTVVTSAVNIAAQLAGEPDIEVIVTGGNLRGTTYALVGSLAEENLRRLHANTLFLGGNGLTVSNGLTTPDLTVAATDRALVEAAERVIVTVDHSKVGRATLCQTAPIDRIQVLVTDAGLPAEQERAFSAAGVEVILA